MTLTSLLKAPFPYPGGKRKAAELIWQLLGDPAHYSEPFAGSLAVLLERPHEPNRAYYSETVNDADGLLVNTWRSIQLHPEATAEACSWPVSEADVHARHVALIRWREERQLEHLMGDPAWCDPVMAGWWLYGICAWIGGEWAHGSNGPWWPDADDRLTKWRKGDPDRPHIGNDNEPGVRRQRPDLSNNGKGVHHAGTREPGVWRQLPHLSDDGRGVHRPQTREPGVKRKRPHLGNNGQGVHHAGTREPGVKRQLPHLTSDGRGVHRPQTREPGVKRKRPHLANNGQGVHHAGTREPGVTRQLPHLSDDGKGVHRPQTREPGVLSEYGYHDMTMPELLRWFAALSARLRHVRIVNGDWTRILTEATVRTLPVRSGKAHAAIFLDPPYSAEADRAAVYNVEDFGVAHDVRAWCIEATRNPKWGDSVRIVLAGYEGEGHEELTEHGWTEHTWFTDGWLTGGYGNQNTERGHQQQRERLWASPACDSQAAENPQQGLFA